MVDIITVRGHGCSGHRRLLNMNILMVWARVVWLAHSLNHECYYGLGMGSLVAALTKPGTLWFEHGCSGCRSH